MNLFGKESRHKTPVWATPTIYVVAAIVAGFTLPRFEHEYLLYLDYKLSVSSAQAITSSIASGMIFFTGIVFALVFLMVQFADNSYSPRLAIWLWCDRVLFNSLGIFLATFCYSIATLAWIDREGSGKVPFLSTALLACLFVASIILFTSLTWRLSRLQVTQILQFIGMMGRMVIQENFHLLESEAAAGVSMPQVDLKDLPVTQTLSHSGGPEALAALDIDSLVRLAAKTDSIIVMQCAVGDTLVGESLLLQVLGGREPISETGLRRAISLMPDRTFEQDPKYAIRLLVDVAIKALSPAVNDPTSAVQAIDQIEDLLHRLGKCKLQPGYACDERSALRLIYPTPTWDDYLTLAFDEIRQCGATSVQVMRRLRAALTDLASVLTVTDRQLAVQDYIDRLDPFVARNIIDLADQRTAMQQDRQGLGMSRRPIGF